MRWLTRRLPEVRTLRCAKKSSSGPRENPALEMSYEQAYGAYHPSTSTGGDPREMLELLATDVHLVDNPG